MDTYEYATFASWIRYILYVYDTLLYGYAAFASYIYYLFMLPLPQGSPIWICYVLSSVYLFSATI